MAKKERLFLAISLFFLVIARVIAVYQGYIFDDALITFRYAENLAYGKGLIYNPGEWVLGTTTPLYAIICAAILQLGFKLESFIPFLNIFLDALILLLVWTFILNNEKRIIKVLFVALFIMSPLAGYIVGSGMETELFILMLLLSFIFFKVKRPCLSGVSGGLAYFCRPEAVVCLGINAANTFFKREYKNLFKFAAPAGAILLAGFAILYHHYGSIFPLSVTHKFTAINSSRLELIYKFIFFDPFTILIMIFALVGLKSAFSGKNQALVHIAYFGILYLALYLIFSPHMAIWYVLPFHFIMLVLAAVGLNFIIEKLKNLTPINMLYKEVVILPVCMVLTLIQWFFIFPHYLRKQEIVVEAGYIKNWCEEVKPSNLAACDIGRVGFYCKETKVFDLCGLVTKIEAIATPEELVNKQKPDYAMIYFPIADIEGFKEIGYCPVGRSGDAANHIKKPSEKDILGPKKYMPDYIFFQKKSPGNCGN